LKILLKIELFKLLYGTFVRVDIEEDGTPVRVKQFSVQESGRQIGQVREMGDFNLTA